MAIDIDIPATARSEQRPAAGALLEVSGLEVDFGVGAGRVRAVRGVDLTIRRGEIVALVGESGSGKSTIGQALMGLVRHGGNAEVAGRADFRTSDGPAVDLLSLPERRLRQLRGNEIAMIFQEPMSSLNPLFTLGTQIGEAIRQHRGRSWREARAEALSLLELLGLPNPRKCLDSYPHQISGGMRQRVMIAMALSCEPSLLIADEPTTALDVTIQAQIVALLKSLQARTGMAILFVTHDLGLVAEIADRVFVLYAGQIVEAAPIAELFAAPRMPYTRALLDAVPRLGSSRIPGYRLRPIRGQAPNMLAPAAGCAFEPRCPHADPVACRTPQPLEEVGPSHHVRCGRWRQIALEAKGPA